MQNHDSVVVSSDHIRSVFYNELFPFFRFYVYWLMSVWDLITAHSLSHYTHGNEFTSSCQDSLLSVSFAVARTDSDSSVSDSESHHEINSPHTLGFTASKSPKVSPTDCRTSWYWCLTLSYRDGAAEVSWGTEHVFIYNDTVAAWTKLEQHTDSESQICEPYIGRVITRWMSMWKGLSGYWMKQLSIRLKW